MAIGRTNAGGGGGGGLNFSVKAYASFEELPSAEKENTIAVIADEINGWIFSATEPTNPSEGLVWIPTGTFSTVNFNALKKNGIEVYPLGAKQYVSDKWVDVYAYIYKDSEWVEFSKVVTELYLYKDGNMFEEITGGWVTFGSGSVSNSKSGLVIKVPSGYKNGGASMKNQIDLTDYDVVKIVMTKANTGGPDLTIRKNGVDVASGNSTIDVSTITGLCEFRFYVADSGSSGRITTVNSILLTK